MSLRRLVQFALSVPLVAISAVSPRADISSSLTNLVVSERTSLVLSFTLPPLEEPYSDNPPILAQKPPHLEVPYLSPEWSSKSLKAGEVGRLNENLRSSRRGGLVFTLNNYVSNDPFDSMMDPFSMLNNADPFESLRPKAQRFPLAAERLGGGKDAPWRFTVTTAPYVAVQPGKTIFAASEIEVLTIDGVERRKDRFGREMLAVKNLKKHVIAIPEFVLTVLAPPEEGRPASYCGAITSNLEFSVSLNTSVCTAGDPLLLTCTVKGDFELSTVRAIDIAEYVDKSFFKVDTSSLKTENFPGERRFTWRIRALKAGTTEFPPVELSWYDLNTRSYKTEKSPAIPIQILAGAQATLMGVDEMAESDALPLPDGINIDITGCASKPLLPRLPLIVLMFVLPPFVYLAVVFIPGVFGRWKARRRAAAKRNAFPKCRRTLLRFSSSSEAKRKALVRFFSVRYDVNGASVTASDAEKMMSGDYDTDDISLVTSVLRDLDRSEYSSPSSTKALLLPLLIFFSLTAVADVSFTWKRACSLATRASTKEDFSAAADAFKECIEQGAANEIVYSNLGGCLYFAERPIEAEAAYSRAELYSGATASTSRGLVAALALRKNTAAVELSPIRSVLSFYYVRSLDERVFAFACAWCLLWALACLRRFCGKGARKALVFFVVSALVANADAQFFRRMFTGGDSEPTEASLKLSPSKVVVGQPCSLVLEFCVPKNAAIEPNFRIGGLPDPATEPLVYGEGFANLADGTSTNANLVIKRFALPVQFLEPTTQTFETVVSGMITTTSGNGTSFTMKSSRDFRVTPKPLTVKVKALREGGRPQDFAGVIGNRFKLTQTPSSDSVHPGDLITMTYRLDYDGYVPTNVFPSVDRITKLFKTYEMKETERTDSKIVWTQVIVPQSVAATNLSVISLPYYSLRSESYEIARSSKVKLTFVSDKAASTVNTAVVLDAGKSVETRSSDANRISVRFAPSENSPEIGSIISTAKWETLSSYGKWIRIRTDRFEGWILKPVESTAER